jgi:hypothetical protein
VSLIHNLVKSEAAIHMLAFVIGFRTRASLPYDWEPVAVPNEQPSGFVLDVVDWQGRRVRMTARTFSIHELRHPEIREYLEEAKQTIADPDIVLEDNDSGVLLYRVIIQSLRFATETQSAQRI